MTTIRRAVHADVEAFERAVTSLHSEMATVTEDPYVLDTEQSYLALWQHWFDTHVHWDKSGGRILC